ncbi:hypothetical protein GCM10010251_75370 [Streptomyces aurantiogriseus]|uniref:Uncharacterized protein n=1 Tax=Streptomyces aurantiogriseus TaxID=66870 RepID=A0A918KYE4_9ACTN|nr:hypothetical protein GCM10010251_75370 [Streptomyces aurantiogriseus]
MGNAYQLTPLAESLAEHAVQALGSADRVFRARSAFDPTRARREFSLVMTDIQLAISIAPAVRHYVVAAGRRRLRPGCGR